MRKSLTVLAALGVIGLVVVGLGQAGSGGSGDEERSFDLSAAKRQLAGAPAPLAALHAESARLLDGGPDDFRSRLRGLRGHAVVVNKWASWCGPCRREFPIFQRVATERGKDVAFLGVDAFDNRRDALDFLRRYPVPYPSYADPREEIVRSIGAPANYPVTIFFRADGTRAFIHQGEYRSAADLNADIDRYAR